MSEPPDNNTSTTTTDNNNVIPASLGNVQHLSADPRGLVNLLEAGLPLLKEYNRGEADKDRLRYEHEMRLAELGSRDSNETLKFLKPVIWGGSLVLAVIVLYAAYAQNWQFATYVLTAVLGAFSGYGIGQSRSARRKMPTPKETAQE